MLAERNTLTHQTSSLMFQLQDKHDSASNSASPCLRDSTILRVRRPGEGQRSTQSVNQSNFIANESEVLQGEAHDRQSEKIRGVFFISTKKQYDRLLQAAMRYLLHTSK